MMLSKKALVTALLSSLYTTSEVQSALRGTTTTQTIAPEAMDDKFKTLESAVAGGFIEVNNLKKADQKANMQNIFDMDTFEQNYQSGGSGRSTEIDEMSERSLSSDDGKSLSESSLSSDDDTSDEVILLQKPVTRTLPAKLNLKVMPVKTEDASSPSEEYSDDFESEETCENRTISDDIQESTQPLNVGGLPDSAEAELDDYLIRTFDEDSEEACRFGEPLPGQNPVGRRTEAQRQEQIKRAKASMAKRQELRRRIAKSFPTTPSKAEEMAPGVVYQGSSGNREVLL